MNLFHFKKFNAPKGFTLIEIIIYVLLLSIIVVVVVNVFFSETNAWGHARAERIATDAGKLIMERIIQEVRLARSIDTSQSILGSHPGKLFLNTFESATSTIQTTLEIFLDGTELKMKRGAQAAISLSGPIKVTQLIFFHMASEKSSLVRLNLTIETSGSKFTKIKNFTSATILRNSY